MTIAAQPIIKQVAGDLNDLTSIRWTIPELCGYFNDGQRDIVMHRPDAGNLAAVLTLVAGYKQTLPAGGQKLIDIMHNIGGTQAAIRPADRKLLDAIAPGWRSMTASATIQHYLYDQREPSAYEVYPPATLGAQVQGEYVAAPTAIAIPADGTTYANVVGNMALRDEFSNALVNYIMYRAYRKNTEYAANPARAQAFYAAYATDLGVELQGLTAVKQAQKSREL